MSDFLLHKSYKLLQESKNIKKIKKSEKQRLKKKKNCLVSKQLQEIEFQKNILKNLKKLEQLNEKTAVNISEKILPEFGGHTERDSEEEEPTVFTDKDFEDFEKEYFDS